MRSSLKLSTSMKSLGLTKQRNSVSNLLKPSKQSTTTSTIATKAEKPKGTSSSFSKKFYMGPSKPSIKTKKEDEK